MNKTIVQRRLLAPVRWLMACALCVLGCAARGDDPTSPRSAAAEQPNAAIEYYAAAVQCWPHVLQVNVRGMTRSEFLDPVLWVPWADRLAASCTPRAEELARRYIAAGKMPRCEFDLEASDRRFMFPRVLPMRAATFLLDDALARIHLGDLSGAAQRIAAFYRFAYHVSRDPEPVFNFQLCRWMRRAVQIEEFARASGRLTADDERDLRDALALFPTHDPFNCIGAIRNGTRNNLLFYRAHYREAMRKPEVLRLRARSLAWRSHAHLIPEIHCLYSTLQILRNGADLESIWTSPDWRQRSEAWEGAMEVRAYGEIAAMLNNIDPGERGQIGVYERAFWRARAYHGLPTPDDNPAPPPLSVGQKHERARYVLAPPRDLRGMNAAELYLIAAGEHTRNNMGRSQVLCLAQWVLEDPTWQPTQSQIAAAERLSVFSGHDLDPYLAAAACRECFFVHNAGDRYTPSWHVLSELDSTMSGLARVLIAQGEHQLAVTLVEAGYAFARHMSGGFGRTSAQLAARSFMRWNALDGLIHSVGAMPEGEDAAINLALSRFALDDPFGWRLASQPTPGGEVVEDEGILEAEAKFAQAAARRAPQAGPAAGEQ